MAVVVLGSGDDALRSAALTSLDVGEASGSRAGAASIVTGDARAVNSSVVLICQLDDLVRPCRTVTAPTLGPAAQDLLSSAGITPVRGRAVPVPSGPVRVATPPSTRPPAVPAPGAPSAGQLPATGADSSPLLIIAGGFVVARRADDAGAQTATGMTRVRRFGSTVIAVSVVASSCTSDEADSPTTPAPPSTDATTRRRRCGDDDGWDGH